MSFYDLDPPAQQRRSFARLSAYLRDYVGPYHPYLRAFYREAGVSAATVDSLEAFRRLPLLERRHLQGDPQRFILQPRAPGSPAGDNAAETEPLGRRRLLGYALQALLNRPRDPAVLVRRTGLADRIRRRALLEWQPIHFHVSSGSSGEPVPVSFSAFDLRQVVGEMAALAIHHKHPRPEYLPFDWSERKLVLLPGAPHIAFYAAVLTKVLAGSPSFETFGGAVIPTDRQIAMFVRGGFQSVVAIPSYLVHWLRRAMALRQEGRVGPLRTLRRVVLGAEPVSEALREHIRALAIEAGAEPRLRILQSAGMTEMKWTFFECAERSGIHLNPRYYYWELLHPDTREPVGPGEPGVLVFTHVGWRGTVLVRYWTGDLVKGGMVWTRCEHCGYTFPRLFPPICRADQDFTKIKGTRVDLQLLVEVVRDTPGVRSFQIVLASEDPDAAFSRDLLVLHVATDPACAPDALERALCERVKGFTEVSPDRIVFEADAEALERRLFANRAMKAEFVVERRAHRAG